MTHEEFYQLPEAGRLPRVGDTIRVNYGSGLRVGYRVIGISPTGWSAGYSFVCLLADGSSREPLHLNGYQMVAGRCLRIRPYAPGTAGWLSNAGGWNGDGFDEIRIEQPALQPALFDLLQENVSE